MVTGEGWMSPRSLVPNIPSSHGAESTETTGAGSADELSVTAMDDGDMECVRVEVDEGDSVRLEWGMELRGGRPFVSREEDAAGCAAT